MSSKINIKYPNVNKFNTNPNLPSIMFTTNSTDTSGRRDIFPKKNNALGY